MRRLLDLLLPLRVEFERFLRLNQALRIVDRLLQLVYLLLAHLSHVLRQIAAVQIEQIFQTLELLETFVEQQLSIVAIVRFDTVQFRFDRLLQSGELRAEFLAVLLHGSRNDLLAGKRALDETVNSREIHPQKGASMW